MIRGGGTHEQEGPQVNNNSRATALLGPPGVALLAVSSTTERRVRHRDRRDHGLVPRGVERRDACVAGDPLVALLEIVFADFDSAAACEK